MPGYVMHLAEADMIIRALRGRMDLSEQWVEHFITGNLLPDTKLRDQKYISHFWSPREAGLMAQAPDLDLFLSKYSPSMEDPLLLGYFTHLYLDTRFVHNFWPLCMAFYNSQGHIETQRDRIDQVEILKTGERVHIGEFFSPAYYYGDYSRMNAYFVETYHITRAPVWQDIKDFKMDEVNLADMQLICRNLDWLFAHCAAGQEKDLLVFDLEAFDSFIHETAEEFMKTYLLT